MSLLYHRQLDDQWRADAAALKAKLSSQFNVNIIGRARKQKIDLDKDFVVESLQVNDNTFLYKQIENSFTQPNAKVSVKMLEWAIDATQNSKGIYSSSTVVMATSLSHWRKTLIACWPPN